MKNCFKLALAGLALATISTASHADLSTSGAVGLPLNPTAQIPAQDGGFRIQGNYFDLKDSNGKYYNLVTAVRAGDNIEVSGGYGKLDSDVGDSKGFLLGAKYLFTRESDPAGVRIAAGANYNRAFAKNITAYVVGSKYLGAVSGDRVPVTAHLGLRYDKFDVAGDDNQVSIYGGIEVPIVRTGEFQFVGEVGSKIIDGGKTPYSASVRYRPKGQPFGASIGVARQGVSNDSGLFAQVGYTFGGVR